MFRPSYLKEGPGVAKDAPEKTGAAWVGETLAREFWQLVKLNVLFLLCCLPVVTFGAARSAMARCTVNMARDVPNDVWTDFRAALRQDTEDVRGVSLERCAIAIGSEGQGLSDAVLAMCRKTLKIPMSERCESLNAAIAAAVLLWESYR